MKLNDYLSRFTESELASLISVSEKKYLDDIQIDREDLCNYIHFNMKEIINEQYCRNLFLSHLSGTEKNNLSNYNYATVSKFFEMNNSNNSIGRKVLTIEPCVHSTFYELLDYQAMIKGRVLDFVEKQEASNNYLNRMLIHMPTGTGKTKTTMHILSQFYNERKCDGVIIWLAHTTELLNQAFKTFKNVWEVLGRDAVEAIVQEYDYCRTDHAVYFLNYAKLISMNKTNPSCIDDFIHNASLIVCDEAHKTLADETKKVINKLMTKKLGDQNKLLLGLTATPGRKFNDFVGAGENNSLALMFEKNITSIKPSNLSVFSYDDTLPKNESQLIENDKKVIKYFQDKRILAKIKREEITYDDSTTSDVENKYFSKKGLTKDFSAGSIGELGKIYVRNKAIIDKLINLNNNGIPTILFACSNEHGRLLSNILTLSGVNNYAVFGDTPEKIRKTAIEDFEKGKYNILINYEILTTGFDSPNIKCVFITRPTNSIVLYSQMLGRGLRGPKMGGNEECTLIDVRDNLKKFNDENFAFSYFNEYWR